MQRRAAFLAFVMLVATPALAQTTSYSTGHGTNLGYRSVGHALAAMHAKPGVKVSVQDGWTIIEDRADSAIWSFTPAGHPADPSAVRRRIVEEGGTISVRMTVSCEAQKAACDQLVADFNKLNDRMRQDVNRRR
jgi:hypothetical protein